MVLIPQHHAPAATAGAEAVKALLKACGEPTRALVLANAELDELGCRDDDRGLEDLGRNAIG